MMERDSECFESVFGCGRRTCRREKRVQRTYWRHFENKGVEGVVFAAEMKGTCREAGKKK